MDQYQKLKQAVSLINKETTLTIPKADKLSKSLLDVYNDYLFLWNELDSSVVAISLRNHEYEKVHLVPTDTPFFQVNQLLISPSGKWICIYGKKGAIVMEMPRRSGKHGRFLANSSKKVGDEYCEIVCRVIPIMDRLFFKHPKLVVHQALWHPGSIYEGHIVLLTSDNTLRILNINSSQSSSGKLGLGQNPDQSIPLSSSLMNNYKPVSSGLGVKESLGEVAIGFTYGPPLGNKSQFLRRRHLSGGTYNEWDEDKENEENHSPIYWPVFCLYGNGDVYCFLTGLGDNAIYQPDIVGPLPMFPQANDNYEAESNGSYKAISCLHPAHPAAPPILVTATPLTIYHAIILNNQQLNDDNTDLSDTESCTGSDWSSSVFGRVKNNKRTPPNLSLHVYETLEINPSLLELSKQHSIEQTEKNKQIERYVTLRKDPSTHSRYFCSHSAGLHSITLPMVDQLKHIAQDDGFEGKSTDVGNLPGEDSSIEHLLATKPELSNNAASSITGLSVIPFPSPTRLMCLLNGNSIEVLTLSSTYIDSTTSLFIEDEEQQTQTFSTKHKEVAFDRHIAKLLQKRTTQPILKTGVNELSGKESYEMLVQSTATLRQEYLSKLGGVQGEIERHVATLRSRKEAQQSAINRLQHEKRGLMETATKLSETYDDLTVNNQKLSSRLEKVLLKIQQQLPVRSDAELRMQRELLDVERKMKNLKNAMEQIRTKEKYQVRQIKQGEDNNKGENGCNSPNNRASLLGENKLSNIKQVLQTNSKDIEEHIKDVNEMKHVLGI